MSATPSTGAVPVIVDQVDGVPLVRILSTRAMPDLAGHILDTLREQFPGTVHPSSR